MIISLGKLFDSPTLLLNSINICLNNGFTRKCIMQIANCKYTTITKIKKYKR